jgi:hypothetical protein
VKWALLAVVVMGCAKVDRSEALLKVPSRPSGTSPTSRWISQRPSKWCVDHCAPGRVLTYEVDTEPDGGGIWGDDCACESSR